MIRLALIGCDDAASADVAIRPRLQGATFAAAVDPDPDKASRAAHALGASISSTSLNDLLAKNSDAFDAVIVNTANRSHGPLAEKAALAGKHVLVETPLALSTEAADAAIEACRSAGVRLMVGQAMRFIPSHQKVRESLASGTAITREARARLRLCVESVEVNPDGTMTFNVSWQAEIEEGLPVAALVKQSDVGNTNMYVTDDKGNRYDFIDLGGAAREETTIPNGEKATGWFLFPPPRGYARNFIFIDDDNHWAIPGILLVQ